MHACLRALDSKDSPSEALRRLTSMRDPHQQGRGDLDEKGMRAEARLNDCVT